MVNRDFRDLFAEFNAHGVEFLIVGAYALAVHGHLRATKDLDVWVRPSAENAQRVFSALEAFGAAIDALSASDFTQLGTVVQLGVAPTRIDILTRIGDIRFEEAWLRRIEAKYGDQPVSVLSRRDLIAAKRAFGRLQDLADIEALEQTPDDETA